MSTKKYYEKDSFKTLQNEWENKLLAAEFEDITTHEEEYVVQPQVFKTNKVQSITGLDYYEYCQLILREYNFERDVDLVIFEQHTEGKSVREIEEYLKKNDFKPIKYRQVHNIIERIKETFGRS